MTERDDKRCCEGRDDGGVIDDVAVIRRAMREIDEGRGMEAVAFFDDLRAALLAMEARPADVKPR